jgi:microcystin-dependent protein
MSCKNCYSGCVDIQTDKCVKYTGTDIPLLGIQNGDSINYVQSAIMGFLISTLDGTGIKFEIDPTNLCDIVSNELQECSDITIKDISNALSAAICGLDTRVTALEAANTALEANYSPLCVPGIAGSEGTHTVVQAVIDHLCTVTTDLDALELDVSTNYVLIADINKYIENYLGGLGGGTAQKSKMIPYTVMEYYGPLTYFDATGAGTGDWAEIYLCNGNNGTPDKRGRIAVGTTSGMGGGAFPSATDPLISGNPTYLLYTTTGTNVVTLTETDIPAHTHVSTLSTDGNHSHFISANETDVDDGNYPLTNTHSINRRWRDGDHSENYALRYSLLDATVGLTNDDGDHTHTVTVNSTGGGGAHNNIPPVLACHYIIYIPTT